jgi:hypothetical protein
VCGHAVGQRSTAVDRHRPPMPSVTPVRRCRLRSAQHHTQAEAYNGQDCRENSGPPVYQLHSISPNTVNRHKRFLRYQIGQRRHIGQPESWPIPLAGNADNSLPGSRSCRAAPCRRPFGRTNSYPVASHQTHLRPSRRADPALPVFAQTARVESPTDPALAEMSIG